MAEIQLPPLFEATDAEVEAVRLALVASIAAKYTKPGTGIPASDLTAGVQASLAAGDAAVTDSELQVVAAAAAAKYTKPTGGIPRTDLTGDVQDALGAIEEGFPADVGTAYSNPSMTNGLVSFTVSTHWGIRSDGTPYYDDDASAVPDSEAAILDVETMTLYSLGG